MRLSRKRMGLLLGGCLSIAGIIAVPLAARGATSSIDFRMVRSATAVAAGCLPNARARVLVTSSGPVETMKVHVSGLPGVFVGERTLQPMRHKKLSSDLNDIVRWVAARRAVPSV